PCQSCYSFSLHDALPIWMSPVRWGDVGDLRAGDPLYVIGFALGDELLGDPTVTRGVLSGRRMYGQVDYIQTDAAMNPGNSGGPRSEEHTSELQSRENLVC